MAIHAERLTKTYRVAKKEAGLKASLQALFHKEWTEVQAVRELSFDIPDGARVGFLGPNGAGKTTTLKMLSGLLTPSSGTVSVEGLSPIGRPRALLRQLSLVMGQKQQLLWDLPPIETFELCRAIYDVDRARYKKTVEELVSMLALGPLLEKPARQLSLGERMKCELAAALIHEPKVLFLDEPTIGLDVSMQAVVRRFIKDYNETKGALVILTSHNMDDVSALCPRVLVIDHGEKRFDGDLKALIAETEPEKRITVELAGPVEAAVIAGLEIPGIQAQSPVVYTVQVLPSALPETVRALLDALPVSDLRVEDPPLEEVMQQIFGARSLGTPDAQVSARP
ncbi:MAG: ATP-binding cassette domain-containing protein [Myxococcota bacterium]